MGGKVLEFEHDRILKQGEARGEAGKTIASIEAVMKNLKVSLEQACSILGITKGDYDEAKSLLSLYK